ncbi:hypothetical protein ACFVWP_42085 [Streptomyces sp. NPDC058175]|uniref:hypothetical protein n=1 Tax=Streptomyces sp. NPDC058175 TaxID=3346367 RepID=UPI0036EA9BD4
MMAILENGSDRSSVKVLGVAVTWWSPSGVTWLDERMTDWSALTDACGPAEHVAGLLDRFEADPSSVWSEVMDHLCPQLDTAFPASYAALPRLAEIAIACSAEDLAWVLLAAGAIAACSPGLSKPGSPQMVYSAPIRVLHRLTDRHLSRAVEAGEYVNLLQTQGCVVFALWPV